MKSKKMRKSQRARILAYFESQMDGAAIFNESDILESLPAMLASEISCPHPTPHALKLHSI
eukprot:COSAG05_NODE_1747_length_4151_cov_4.600197_7_plen_61_part_00